MTSGEPGLDLKIIFLSGMGRNFYKYVGKRK
jgi:hypothetical protein